MKNYLLAFLLFLTFHVNAQYQMIYENSFRNWLPGQGWIMLDNDTITTTAGLQVNGIYAGVPVATLEVLDYMLGVGQLTGDADKIMMTPPVILGATPHMTYYSWNYSSGASVSVWLVRDENDTTLTGLSDSLGISVANGFNSYDLSTAANDTVRIAFRIQGLNAKAVIDNLKIFNYTSMAYVPDVCFRNYLQSVLPAAFSNDSLDYLRNDVLNLTVINHPNSCIQSLEGLQYFPFLQYLNVHDNNINYIPGNPIYYLDSLEVSNNQLNFLPDVPTCTVLRLNNNIVANIPDYFNQYCSAYQAVNNMIDDCFQCTNRFVRADFSGNVRVVKAGCTYYYLTLPPNNPQLPPIVCSQEKGVVGGIVYYDVDQNGVFDSTDFQMFNQRIHFYQGLDLFTNLHGRYAVTTDTGFINMDVTAIPSNFNCVNPLVDTLHDEEIIYHDFQIISTSTSVDLGVNVNATGTTRVGETLSLNLNIYNHGTSTETGNFTMNIPPGFIVDTFQYGTIGNDTLYWSASVTPFGSVNNLVILIPDTVISQQDFIFNAEVTINNDIYTVNNTDSVLIHVLPPQITWSPWDNGGFPFDPNNKLVNTPSVPPGFNDYLEYNINFQNIGTANATRVLVRDYLPSQLDLSTFEFISSSHPCEVILEGDTMLNFVFYPIALTPDSIDPVNSHGHLWFRIKPYSALQIGDTIRNSAEIYFDTQPAVVTEQCLVWADTIGATLLGIASTSDTIQVHIDSLVAADIIGLYSDLIDRSINNAAGLSFSVIDTSIASFINGNVFQGHIAGITMVIVTYQNFTDTFYIEVLHNTIYIQSTVQRLCGEGDVQFHANGFIQPVAVVWSFPGDYPPVASSLNPIIHYDTPGTYGITFTAYWTNDTVVINEPVYIVVDSTPVVNITGNDTICFGNFSILDAGAGYSTYLWNNTSTTQTIAVGVGGTYIATVTGANGCTGSGSFQLLTVPVDTTVSVSGNVLTSNQPNAVYQWFSCLSGIINGATNQSLVAPQTGSYSVSITIGDCITFSNCIGVTVTGLAETVSPHSILFYPNPVGQSLHIQPLTVSGATTIRFIDISGRIIMESNLMLQSGQDTEIPLNDLASGIYMMQLLNDDISLLYKLQKL